MVRIVQYIVGFVWIILLVIVPAGAVHAQQPPSAVRVTQVDSSQYPEVTVYVAVEDASGKAVAGFGRNDFQMTEDGTPVDIVGFRGSGESAISTALIMDRSGSMLEDGKIRGARDAAHAFVSQMKTSDRTTLVGFNSSIRVFQRLSNDKAVLDNAIDRIDAEGGTALYDSVVQGVDLLKDAEGRSVLLVLTDGMDCREFNNCPAEAGSVNTLNEAIDYANNHGQPVYVVGLGEYDIAGNAGIDEKVLRQLAEKTYGEYFHMPDAKELAALYRKLSGSFHKEYALTYRSPRPFYDGTRRDIEVSVGDVVSRGGYTEQHLINVRSHIVVGILLLIPLLVLLILPQKLGWTKPSEVSAEYTEDSETSSGSTAQHVPVEDEPDDTPADSQHDRTGGDSVPVPGKYCVECGKPLREGAKFCGSCGTQQ